MTAAPIIVTALIGEPEFLRLDTLRGTHFPPERNFLRAHLTLFHHLPPSCYADLKQALREEARGGIPAATLLAPISLGRGVAFGVASRDLALLRERLADRFSAVLTPQDRAAWRPHITVQNKVTPDVARSLLTELTHRWRPGALPLSGLAAWWYCGGPWEPIVAYAFGTGRTITAPV